MTTQQQVEEWVDKKRWRTNTQDSPGALVGGGVVLSIIWAFVSSLAQLALWDFALGWDAKNDVDEVPPYFAEVLVGGLAIIALLTVGIVIASSVEIRRAQLPHQLGRSQLNAAFAYGKLESNDQVRARVALVDLLMYDEDVFESSEFHERNNRWISLLNRINEKNALYRKLSIASSRGEEVDREVEVLDAEIADLKTELKQYKELI